MILSFIMLWLEVVLSIHLSRRSSHHPSIQVLHPGRKRWKRRRQMAATAVYPNILTIRNFFKTLKSRNKMKTYKINIFKHETRKGNIIK
jgi:hypothetical protein